MGAIMQTKIFTIRDTKGGYYNTPFFKNSAGEAQREFDRLANDEKSTIFQYPSDFDLYYIGDLDNITGKITPLDIPTHICSAVSVKRISTGLQSLNATQ